MLSGVLQQGSSMLSSSGSSNLAANFSQQVSPWLAMGCLSPRRMYQEVCPALHPASLRYRGSTSAYPTLWCCPFLLQCPALWVDMQLQARCGQAQAHPAVCRVFRGNMNAGAMQVKARQQGCNQKVVSQAMTELLWRDFFRFTSKKYASLSLKQRSPDAVAVCA